MPVTTYAEVLAIARRLPLSERLRLASVLVSEAAGEVTPVQVHQPFSPEEALAALDAVRAHFAEQGAVSPTIAEDLLTSRR